MLVRNLAHYHQDLQRVFARYGIPCFLDRREAVSHHPLAELTRSALRTIAWNWEHEDWFAALKSGFITYDDAEIDRLENEALARGWTGNIWRQPITVPNEPDLSRWVGERVPALVRPFLALADHLRGLDPQWRLETDHSFPAADEGPSAVRRDPKPNGRQLASALRRFWHDLGVEAKLESWAETHESISGWAGPAAVHDTVWNQVNAWVDNVELAFPEETLGLREWLPILEAGLANLSAGVIPPALDQVVVGSIERSRDPALKIILVLGLNESVFPAPPPKPVLLNEADRQTIQNAGFTALDGHTARTHLARERFLGYQALTRAQDRVVVTCATHDSEGAPLSPSLFLGTLEHLFPDLRPEIPPRKLPLEETLHLHEWVEPAIRLGVLQTPHCNGRARLPSSPNSLPAAATARQESRPPDESPSLLPTEVTAREDTRPPEGQLMEILQLPKLQSLAEQLRHLHVPNAEERLTPELAGQVYGPALKTSVSRIEHFAACPFKFFVHSGLRAEERQRFELDVREQGSFQHDVLARFHEELQRENKRWRDIEPKEARERIARIAADLMASYRDGLLQSTEEARFLAQTLTGSLQDFIEILVGWMRSQYQFDPVSVELPFGEDPEVPAWSLPLGEGRGLKIYGRIDRVDLLPTGDGGGLCVVIDYKSSLKRIDPLLMANGIQLQLLTYLSVLRHWPDPTRKFGVSRLIPAGVFYVNLRGFYESGKNRGEALANPLEARRQAYQHVGRFNASILPHLDSRPDVQEGDQFNFRLTKSGEINKSCKDPMLESEFTALLDSAETTLKRMALSVYEGTAAVAPFKKGSLTACLQCDYQSICRIDPWSHRFRKLEGAP